MSNEDESLKTKQTESGVSKDTDVHEFSIENAISVTHSRNSVEIFIPNTVFTYRGYSASPSLSTREERTCNLKDLLQDLAERFRSETTSLIEVPHEKYLADLLGLSVYSLTAKGMSTYEKYFKLIRANATSFRLNADKVVHVYKDGYMLLITDNDAKDILNKLWRGDGNEK